MNAWFTLIVGLATVGLNFYVTVTCLKRKHSLWLTTGTFFLVTIVYTLLTMALPEMPLRKQLYLVYLVPIILMFEGAVFQKLYMFFTVVLRCGMISSAIGFTLQWILPHGTDQYIQVYIVAVLVAYGIYVWITRRFTRSFYQKLFAYTGRKEWALYTVGLLLTYNAFRFLYFGKGVLPQRVIEDPLSYILVFFASLSSYISLCYAIIKTHQKAAAEYDLQFTKSLLASGQEHYKKLHEQRELVSILQHDYKHQLNTVYGLLHAGEKAEAENLLAQFRQQFDDQTLPVFCENAVVNAQIAEFYLRCKNRGISFETEIHLPSSTGLDNYELCILIGNLLENAWDACTAPEISGKKWITVNVKFTAVQIAVRVQNSFDGVVHCHSDGLISRKNGAGLGIKSINAVAARYGGNYLPDWNGNVFTAYVLLHIK